MIFSAISSMRGSGRGRSGWPISLAWRTSSWVRKVVSRISSPRASSAQMRSRVLMTRRPMAITPFFSIAARITAKASMPVLPDGTR